MKYKSVFISDVHIGFRSPVVDKLLHFLKKNEFDNVFLLGDIVDGWKLKRGFKLSKGENNLIRYLLKISRKVDNFGYCIGNHDDFILPVKGTSLGSINFYTKKVYESIDGSKVLLVHGDQFDAVLSSNIKLAKLGAWAYELLFKFNRAWGFIRRNLGFKSHWSFSQAIKSKVKDAVKYVNNFEYLVSEYAKINNCHIVICGHIHTPADKIISDIRYINCGDTVENNTIVVETMDGQFKHIYL